MDLIFNRKVVKPIRGGAASSSNRRSSNARDGSSQGRASIQKAMTFNEFMQNQQSSNNRTGRQSMGALRSPARAPPLVKPE